MVNDFTELKMTPKEEECIERTRQLPPTPKFKINRKLAGNQNFDVLKNCKITVSQERPERQTWNFLTI